MKKQIVGIAAVTAVLGAGALAGSDVFADIDCGAVDNVDNLGQCFSVGGNVTLSGDVEIPVFNALIESGKTVKLDLAGHDITVANDSFPAIWIKEGHLEIVGEGTITASASDYPAILVSGSTEKNASNYSSLAIGKDVKLVNNNYAAISVDKYNTEGAFHGVKIDFSGMATGKYGIQVGKNADSFDGANLPIINIHDGAKINAETDAETDAPGQAIRAEGRAIWNIGKATITGDTGIALRAGKFYLNGPVVTATGPEEAYIHYFALDKSGDTPCDPDTSCEKLPGSGAAIQIQEAQTEAEDGINDIEIFINGGTYKSKYGYALAEYKERVEDPNPTVLTDTAKTIQITDGNLVAFDDIDDIQKSILGSYTLAMVTDDFSWRFGDGRMCADGSASVKSYDEDWLRTHFEVHPFATISGLDKIYTDLPWIERLLVDYVHFPGPYNQYDFDDAENVALDVYAESKGIDYEDIKFTNLFDIVLYRFEEDNYEFSDGEEGYFRGSLTNPGSDELGSGTSKPYVVIRDTEDYPLTFTMKLPEDIPAVEEGYVRSYFVLDLHCTSGGTQGAEETCEVYELPATLSEDGTEYTFTTTKFSAFVLTYFDTVAPEPEPEDPSVIVPNTGYLTEDSADMNGSSASFAVAGIVATIVGTSVGVGFYRILRK